MNYMNGGLQENHEPLNIQPVSTGGKSRAHLLIFACRNRDFLWSEGVAPAYKKYLMIINLVGAHGTEQKNKVSFCGENTKDFLHIGNLKKRR